MKKLIILIASLATLAGCAAPGPGPANYGSRGYAQSGDPNGWQTVSVTPVPLGTGARAGDAGVVTSSNVVVNPTPMGGPMGSPPGAYRGGPGYAPGYGYSPQPVYGYPPVYVQDPYWTPPVSIGLGLSFGRSWSSGHHHRRHYRRR